MSAPFKQKLDYFSHDTDMSGDPKIEYIEAIHGLPGYAVFLKLLEKIYRNGYYINWGKRDAKIFARKNNIEFEKCQKIVEDCINEELFDTRNYKEYNILTSQGIQKRYLKSSERRAVVHIIYEFLNVDIKWINVNINSKNVTIKRLNGDIYRVIARESKVKESKVKKRSNKTFGEDSNEIKLAKNLLSLIRLHNPKFKEPDIQSWAKDIDLMVRLDKRTTEEINRVIEWAQKDSFWHTNILSPNKLRKKFDELIVKMNRYKKKVSSSDGISLRDEDDPQYDTYLSEMKRRIKEFKPTQGQQEEITQTVNSRILFDIPDFYEVYQGTEREKKYNDLYEQIAPGVVHKIIDLPSFREWKQHRMVS